MIKNWILATRPKTLPAALSPVMIGTAMALGDGIGHIPTAILCLLAAVTIQVGTNLANDYFDFKKGTDTSERVGPTRVTQAGLIKPSTVLAAALITFLASAFICYLLYLRAGMPIVIIGIASILSGLFYTAGPRPLGYLGLGDIFVLIFFGPVAVGGTYYVQSFEINFAVILAGFAPGLISTGILCVNNLRDRETDAKHGKLTLAVRFGETFAKAEYLFSIIGASLIPVLIYGLIQDHVGILFASVTAILAIPVIVNVLSPKSPQKLNKALSQTGALLLIYSVIFSFGWLT